MLWYIKQKNISCVEFNLIDVALRKSGTFMPHKYQDLRVKAKHYINAYLDIGTEKVPYNYVLPLTVFDIPNVY